MTRFVLALIACLLPLYAGSPVVFYSDLTSGPKTGGENGHGVFVTINGKYFGSSQGTSTITLGGGAVTVKSWSDSKIVFQPGPGAVTGTIVVTVGGTPSACAQAGNCDFTVRSGNVYCVSQSAGDDGHDGKFPTDPTGNHSGCWATTYYAIRHIAVGDTIYLGANANDPYQSPAGTGTCASTDYVLYVQPAYGCGIAGTASMPIGFGAYPGNTAVLGRGDNTTPNAAYWNPKGYWTIFGLTLLKNGVTVSNTAAVNTQGKGHRIINNDVQVPYVQTSAGGIAMAITGAVEGVDVRTNRIYGNHIHNVNMEDPPGSQYSESSKHSFLIYLGSDGNEQEVAWNTLDGRSQNGHGDENRCIHVHSSPVSADSGFPMWGIHIHDNIISGCGGNTIDTTVDPGRGSGVDIYNNLIYDTGNCPRWTGMASTYYVFNFSGSPDFNWRPESGVVKVYNNTVYNTGSCMAYGNGSARGLFSGPWWYSWSGGMSSPPPPVTTCASGCTGRTYSGTLPPTSYTPYYFPNGVAFLVYESNPETSQSLVDDGAGNLTQDGKVVGTINYATGAYSFTLLRTPVNPKIYFEPLWLYRVEVKNNIFYLKSGQKWASLSDSHHGLQLFKLDHNLFYSADALPAPSWPLNVKNSVGSNSDPQFVSAATGDFHLSNSSPAAKAGVDTGIARDFDGALRQGFDLGALSTTATGAATSPITTPSTACDVNKDGKVDNTDVQLMMDQVQAKTACVSDINGDGVCNVVDLQRVILSSMGQACNTAR